MDVTIEQFDTLTQEVHSLRALCINLRDLIEGGISTNNLHANSIQTNNIKNDAITSNKIIAGAITANHIQALAIDASKIAVGTITSSQIKDGTVAADDIQSGTITALQISTGTITAGLLKTGGQAFSHNMVFSSTDADTVSWTAGTLKTADGTAYSIDAGNTGNMAARTYIYLDKSVSVTVLQVSTSYDAPLGDNRIPIATAQNGTGNAVFQVFAGGGGVFISGGMIAAHTITGTEITGNSLAAIRATLGSVTAGNIQGTRLQIGGGTDEDIYFEDSGIRMYDYGTNTIRIYKSGVGDFRVILNAGVLHLWTTADNLVLGPNGRYFTFRQTGQLQLPQLSAAPTSGLVDGQLAVPTIGLLHNYHHSAWYLVQTTVGW